MRPTLQNQVYERMRDALLLGRLHPGQKMTNRQLATAMDVSVTPVREALQRLVTEHVLKMLPNGSVVVPVLTEDEVTELYAVTKSLEMLAARLGLDQAENDLLDQIGAKREKLQSAYKEQNWSAVIEANYGMHFLLYEQAASPYLLSLIRQLWMRKGPHYQSFFKIHYDENRGAFLEKIMAAFSRKELEVAVREFEALIESEFNAWITLVKTTSPPQIHDAPIDGTIFERKL